MCKSPLYPNHLSLPLFLPFPFPFHFSFPQPPPTHSSPTTRTSHLWLEFDLGNDCLIHAKLWTTLCDYERRRFLALFSPEVPQKEGCRGFAWPCWNGLIYEILNSIFVITCTYIYLRIEEQLIELNEDDTFMPCDQLRRTDKWTNTLQ